MRSIEIHDAAMVRALAYDCGLVDPERILDALGFPPVSDDGARIERETSQKRMARIVGATPLFLTQAGVVATLLAVEHASLEGLEPESLEELLPITAAYQAVALSAIMSSLAYLLDIGALAFNSEGEDE